VSTLLVHPHPADASGCVLTVTPQSAGWKYVGFQVYRLAPGQVIQCGQHAREACVVVLSGSADVAVEGQRFDGIGGRSSVFEDAAPGAVYASAGARFTVTAKDAVELAVCSAPGQTRRPARLIAAADMGMEVRGTGTNTRHVRNILPQTAPADSLLIVEVITPGGHWSSYPPHKHDTAIPGEETALEETYYHRFKPYQGFGFQRVYTDERDLDESLCVQDGDVVMVPRGYHPVCAAHGYDLYYLNVMAGPHRAWVIRNDPQHEWLIRDPGAHD
jgi:5-deoxy-glucuronate isomerase